MKRHFLLLNLAFVAGILTAYVVLTAPFHYMLHKSSRVRSLAGVLGPEQESAVRPIYPPGTDLGRVAWNPPDLPTPFVGSAPRPGVHAGLTINTAQLRYPEEVSADKPTGVFRVFVTGGSTAFGSGATSDGTTVAGWLETLLNGESRAGRYQVITAAHPAWSSTHERILIENRLSELAADVVVSLSGNNDVHWALGGHDVFSFRTYQEQRYWNMLDVVHKLTGHGGLPALPVAGPARVDPREVARKLGKNAELSALALARGGARYVFALQPTLAVTRKPLTPRERGLLRAERTGYFERCYAEIDRTLAALAPDHLLYADLSGAFDRLGERDEVFLDSYHFGDRGNEVVARAIRDVLEPLLPAPPPVSP